MQTPDAPNVDVAPPATPLVISPAKSILRAEKHPVSDDEDAIISIELIQDLQDPLFFAVRS